ncbi:MAG: GNAT family N-acetyltransferase [Pleomorphochaeta sp.]
MDYEIMRNFDIQIVSFDFLKRNIASFLSINNENKEEYWNEDNFLFLLPKKFEWSVCAIINDQVVGFIISSKKDDSICHIHKVAVASKFRGRGIATCLIQYIIDLAHREVKNLSLFVEDENVIAKKMYYKLGFENQNTKLDSVTNKKLLLLCKKI